MQQVAWPPLFAPPTSPVLTLAAPRASARAGSWLELPAALSADTCSLHPASLLIAAASPCHDFCPAWAGERLGLAAKGKFVAGQQGTPLTRHTVHAASTRPGWEPSVSQAGVIVQKLISCRMALTCRSGLAGQPRCSVAQIRLGSFAFTGGGCWMSLLLALGCCSRCLLPTHSM